MRFVLPMQYLVYQYNTSKYAREHTYTGVCGLHRTEIRAAHPTAERQEKNEPDRFCKGRSTSLN